ncbi:MAG: peptidase M16 [Deltaproteobacteria bacterium]|nr:peptidase M16 [Deltaproteobacteria bacterium]HCH63249.1 insulinase family protein [Deltaproteobacteria bacterium]
MANTSAFALFLAVYGPAAADPVPLASTGGGEALATESQAAPDALSIPYERYQLDNGLDVILHVDPTTPQVVVNTWYDVGAKDEVAGRTGFAHLFEHLMFMGTVRLPDDGFDVQMEQHGGWNNAWTSEDATDYYDVGPSHLAELLLWMEADRMDGLAKAMSQEKLDIQREVVRNERRQSYEDSPYGVVWLAMPRVMYPESHPYAHTVIGSHEDLEAATVDDVTTFFDTWYVPSNAGLVVAGDIDPDQVRGWIQETFGRIPSRDLPTRAQPPPPVERPIQPLTELTDQVQASRAFLMWHTPAAFAAGDAAMHVLSGVLSTGRASRLYQRLITEAGVATEVDTGQWSQQYGSVFLTFLTPADGHTCAELEALVHEELARLAKEGPTSEELNRVKAQMRVGFLRSLESLQSRASRLNQYRIQTGDPGFLAQDLARYEAVSAADIQEAAARLSVDRAATIRVHPEPAGDDQ